MQAFLTRLHGVVLKNGFECMPQPHVEWKADVGLDLVWFDTRASRSLGFALYRDDDEDSPKLWMHSLRNNRGHDEFDPTDVDIAEAVRDFGGL
jgi:hypothetical protein